MRVSFIFNATLLGMACMLPLLSSPRSANAAEWSAEPSVRLNRGYNDNIQLTIQPHSSVTSSLFAPKLNLGASSDIWQVAGGVEAVQNRFSGDSNLDADDRFYNLSASYLTERTTWQVAGSVSKSSFLTNQQITPETGVVQVQKVQDASSITPSWTWAMNELTQLQLAYSLQNISYVNGVEAGLYDYSARAITATLTNSLDQNHKVFFSARYSVFNLPAIAPTPISFDSFETSQRSKSSTYQAGITRTFSETARWTLSAGLRKTSIEQDGLQVIQVACPPPFDFLTCATEFRPATFFSKQSGTVFSGNFEKLFASSSFTATMSRSLDSSGTGGQVQTDSLGLSISQSFTPKLTGGLSVISYTSSTVTPNISGIDNRLYSIEPTLHWQWTQELSLDGSYRYTHIRRVAEAQPVTADAVYLTLRYQWQKMAISR
jgi:hypothetical protein